jgi:hypothetical protein
MLDLLAYYFIFAVATSVTSCYFLFWQVLQSAIKKGISNHLTNRPALSVMIHLALGLVWAPVIFVILVVPSFSENYKLGMESVINDKK